MAKKVTELQFTTPNRPGVLSKISHALKAARVNILHVWGCGEGSKACLGVVTSNNARAKQALKKMGIRTKEKALLLTQMPNRAGVLARMADKLAKARVNITSLSATTGGRRVAVLLNTSNNGKASRLL